MRIPEIPRVLEYLYFATRPSTLILGPPGIGKSESVREAAKRVSNRLGLKYAEFTDENCRNVLKRPDEYCLLVDLRLTEVEPADIIGIPRVENGGMIYVPPMWARARSVVKCGFLFLDELTNVQRDDVAAVAYKLILERASGFTKFSEGVMVVAAGNDPDSSPIARPLPAPLINRLLVLKAEPPDVDEWYAYMSEKYGEEFDKRTYLYLSLNREDLLEKPQQLETTQNFATPRSWTTLALIMGRGVYDPEIVDGLLGPAVGSKFKAFLSIKIDVDSVLKDPSAFDELSLDVKFMTINELARMYERGERSWEIEKFLFHLYNKFEWLILFLRMLKPERISALVKSMPEEVVQKLYKVTTIIKTIKK